SSHAGVGTRDLMQAWLLERLPNDVEADVWWREDLDRRLESQWELKRQYGLTSGHSGEALLHAMVIGEVITHPDLPVEATAPVRFTALRKFIRSQFERDSTIRFREADLPTQPLLQNYLDIGARLQLPPHQENRLLVQGSRLRRVRSENRMRTLNEDDFTAAS